MSATNTTPNLGLPKFIATDKPTWLGDFNGAMSTIDNKVATYQQLKDETMGEVIYELEGSDAPATMTLSSNAGSFDTIELLGKIESAYHSSLTSPIQVTGYWRNNDRDLTRNIVLTFTELDPTAAQKREVQDIWKFTNSTTLVLEASTEYSGSLTEPEIDASVTVPHITITKIVGYKSI